jgi:hypothetical protein
MASLPPEWFIREVRGWQDRQRQVMLNRVRRCTADRSRHGWQEDRHERVGPMTPMPRAWQIAALVTAAIFGIAGFLANEGRRSSKPEIALVALAIIGYLVVWLIYLIARHMRRSA